MDGVSAAASVVALLEVSLMVVSLCKEYYSKVKDAKDDINRFRLEFQTFVHILRGLRRLAEDSKTAHIFASQYLAGSITQCQSDLKILQQKLNPGKHQKTMSRFGMRALKWPFQSSDVEKIMQSLERYKSTFNATLNIDQTILLRDVDTKFDRAEQDHCLSKLPYAEGANFDSFERQHEPYCIHGTRVDLLRQVLEWSDNPDKKSIFWLCGMAGTGKSTIARTVAHALAKKKRLAANFFFSRGRGDLSHAGKLLTSIARQMAAFSPNLKTRICEVITNDDRIVQQSMRDQWNKLIYQPLSRSKSIPNSYQTLTIVIDALDECGRQEDIRLLLRLLAEAKDLETVRLRVFITSRPETPVNLGFTGLPDGVYENFVLHNVAPYVIRHDIGIFLKHEMHEIQKERSLDPGWPGERILEILVDKSGGLFIYAATVCRFIGDLKWLPDKRLHIVLEGSNAQQSPTQNLDQMYTQVLTSSIFGECNEKEQGLLGQRFRDVAGPIMVLFDWLSVIDLARILPEVAESISIVLESVKSVIRVPKDQCTPIQLLHPSFRDFLLDEQRCQDNNFWIDQEEAHLRMANTCIGLLSNTLKRDMCSLKQPGTLKIEIETSKIDHYLSKAVQYASRYWVGHVQKSKCGSQLASKIHIFLQAHLLHWLETLCLIGKIPNAVLAIGDLRSIFESEDDTELINLIADAMRFILEFRQIVETAPLQIYNSALLFSPQTSIVRRTFGDQIPKWIDNISKIEKNRTSSLQALEGHSAPIQAVVSSPDGSLLASASSDKTVRLWDPITGELRNTLEGHLGGVNAVAFSPDGHLLASASYDKTVKLWDPITGELRNTFEGHLDSVNAIAFSRDGSLLASASSDRTVRLWDPTTGELRNILKGHLGGVNAVMFSPDDRFLASSSDDETIGLWDPMRGAFLTMIKKYPRWSKATKFSPSGSLLAFASDDNSIRLWDPTTRELQNILEGHSKRINAVAFSPDGHLLASGSDDQTVRLWDPTSGRSRGILKVSSKAVIILMFSPDSSLLASATYDNDIRLWDTITGELRGTLEGHSGNVTEMVFSSNGSLLASASRDETVRLWDLTMITSRSQIEGHSDCVSAVVFSPNGCVLASASHDMTVRLWDPTIGELQCTLEEHSDIVTVIAFSPDGILLASGSVDNTIKLWNYTTGELRNTLEEHLRWITAIAFSPDGHLFVSASHDKTVRLWDPTTGELRNTLEGHLEEVNAVAFSPDCHLLASASYDKTVRLWDPTTGELRNILEGHSGDFNAGLVFSPDGRFLASASNDRVIKLWDTNSGELRQGFNHAHSQSSSFSLNGTHLVMNGETYDLRYISPPISTSHSVHGGALYAFDQTKHWITWNNEKVLWLPPNRRPRVYTFRDSTMVIGNGSGRVTFIYFNSAVCPY